MTTQSQPYTNESQFILSEYRDLLSVRDLSQIFGLSSQTVYKELKAGRFGEPLKFGREYRVPKIYLLNKYFLHNQEQLQSLGKGV